MKTDANTEEKENIVSASNNERTDNETISKVGNNTESGNKSETHNEITDTVGNKNENTDTVGNNNEITDTVGNNNDVGTIVKSNSNTESSDRTENIDRENVEIGSADSTKNQNAESKSEKINASDYRDSEDKLHYDLYSDTPQGALTGVDEEEYLTNARKVTDENSKHGNSNASEIGTSTGNSQEIDKSNTTLASNGAENVNENVEKTSKQDGIENENKTRDYTENSQAKSEHTENSQAKSEYIENSQAKSEYTGNNETTFKMDENQIRSNNTLDSANRTDAKSASADSKIDSTESYLLHVVGKNGGISYSKLLKEFRETFLNIDIEIIRELAPLFMNLW